MKSYKKCVRSRVFALFLTDCYLSRFSPNTIFTLHEYSKKAPEKFTTLAKNNYSKVNEKSV